MLGVLIILAAAAASIAILYYAIRAWGGVEPSVWQAVGIYVAGRSVSRAAFALLPEMDFITKLGVGMVLSILTIGAMLTFWAKVPPIRSLLLAIGLWFFIIIASFIGVSFLPER